MLFKVDLPCICMCHMIHTQIITVHDHQVSYYLGGSQQVVLCIQDISNNEPHLKHVSYAICMLRT